MPDRAPDVWILYVFMKNVFVFGRPDQALGVTFWSEFIMNAITL